MSRSRRHTPIIGMTTAKTDKPFKAAEHRRERRSVRVAITHDDEVPGAKQFGNPAASEKDGKQAFDPLSFPKLMRK